MNTQERRIPTGVLILITGAIAVSVMIAATLLLSGNNAEGASVTPDLLAGPSNIGKECSDLEGTGQTWIQFKLEQATSNLSSGTHTDGTLTVTISNYTFGDTSFDWTSNIGVDGVVVKNGVDGANFYRYDPPTESTGDDGLETPGNQKAISHISFCYDFPDSTPTATPTATPTPTPTPTPTATATPAGTSTQPPAVLAATATPIPTSAALGATQDPTSLPVSGGAPEKTTRNNLSLLLLGLGGLALLSGAGTLVAVGARRRR